MQVQHHTTELGRETGRKVELGLIDISRFASGGSESNPCSGAGIERRVEVNGLGAASSSLHLLSVLNGVEDLLE